MRLPPGVVPEVPGPDQESCWNYPRPPRLRPVREDVVVTFGGVVVCRALEALQILETSHPPTYYLPVASWAPDALRPTVGESLCEWKGRARYFDVVAHDAAGRVLAVAEKAAWGYPAPWSPYEALVDHVAVYPAAMAEVTVDGQRVRAQDGGFYGGWITDRVVGPFKGSPGSWGW